MTIRRRLVLSNILMILVPVAATALIGLLCVGIIWLAVIGGAGLDMHDTEDFNRVSLAVTEIIEAKLGESADFGSVNLLLANNGITARVTRGETEIYSYGASDESDEALYAAAAGLEGSAVVSQNGRSLYKSCENINGEEYTVYLLGGNHSESAYANLKLALAASAVLIALAIFISILLTNRFLTKFVFRRIEEPLDILSNGVHEISEGNLDYRIGYYRRDEFEPVCDDFNEMAFRLKELVDKLQRQEQSRKELLAGISHDIRSPLTSIQAYVEGLLDGVAKTPEAQRAYLTTVKTKAEDLDSLVSKLFLFSKMELGEYPNNAVRLRLDEKIEAAVSDAEAEYAARGMRIETELCPVTVSADPIQLERVITNIMGNSLKYKEAERGLSFSRKIKLIYFDVCCKTGIRLFCFLSVFYLLFNSALYVFKAALLYWHCPIEGSLKILRRYLQ